VNTQAAKAQQAKLLAGKKSFRDAAASEEAGAAGRPASPTVSRHAPTARRSGHPAPWFIQRRIIHSEENH